MGRQKTSGFEDLILIASKLPWWVSLTLAPVSYLCLHLIASRPLAITSRATGLGNLYDGLGTGILNTAFTVFAMFGQYLLPFGFLCAAFISGYRAVKSKRLLNHTTTLTDLSWEDFERLVGEYYRRKGFNVSREGGNGPDGGIDLVLRQRGETYLVQCKQWKAFKVGVQPVREFYGVMASRAVAGGYFVTSGEFTTEARKFAHGLNLELVDGQKLRQMIEVAKQWAAAKESAPLRGNPAKAKSTKAALQTPPLMPAALKSPVCPLCSAEMSKRIARQGANVGKQFWGCTTFPKCKGTRQIEDATATENVAKAAPEIVRQMPPKNDCPHCGTALVMRKFNSGPRHGQDFLACYQCKKGWPLGAGM